jgi:valyl-tRNA synthetase
MSKSLGNVIDPVSLLTMQDVDMYTDQSTARRYLGNIIGGLEQEAP